MASDTTLCLVYIKTFSNQEYLYETHRLSESVGASELIAQSCVHEVNRYSAAHGITISWIVEASGLAIFTCQSEQVAQDLIKATTLAALRQAPGLGICGAYEPFDPHEDTFIECLRQAQQNYERNRTALPHRHARFPRWPFMASCQTSGLPASSVIPVGGEPLAVARVSSCKFAAAKQWQRRLDQMFTRYALTATEKTFAKNTDEFTKNADELDDYFAAMDWQAVVHIDGNQVGALFQGVTNLESSGDESLQEAKNERAIKSYRDTSNALQQITEAAFVHACETVFGPLEGKNWAILPLLLGGDDVTFICDARYAMHFTETFITLFSAYTGHHRGIPRLKGLENPIPQHRAAMGKKILGLSACAGIAITKPHYPFYSAYQLAESLASSGKLLVRKRAPADPASALDFHVLYDSHVFDLDSLRRRKTCHPSRQRHHQLFAGPYLLKTSSTDHSLGELARQVEAIQGGQLPRTQLHQWRQKLTQGKTVSDQHLKLTQHRYHQALQPLLEEHSFFRTSKQPSALLYTYFLDALDISPFWQKATAEGVQV